MSTETKLITGLHADFDADSSSSSFNDIWRPIIFTKAMETKNGPMHYSYTMSDAINDEERISIICFAEEDLATKLINEFLNLVASTAIDELPTDMKSPIECKTFSQKYRVGSIKLDDETATKLFGSTDMEETVLPNEIAIVIPEEKYITYPANDKGGVSITL